MKKRHIVTALALCVAGGASAVPISFTEDFSGLAMPVGMESTINMQADGIDRLDFSGGNATITNPSGEGDKRQYIRTIESDYASVDFVLEATITSLGTGWWEAAYIGLGTGELGAFNEPTGGPFIGLEHGADDHSRWALRDGGWRNSAAEATGGAWSGDDSWTAGTHRVRLTYTVADQQMYSEVDKDYTGGAFVADLTSVWSSNGSDDGFDASNAHIFFGAGNNTSFDDISVTVIPEPATFSLLVAFGGAMLFVRKRFKR